VALTSKDHRETSAEGLAAKAAAEKADTQTAAPVQKAVDATTEVGYVGIKVDPLHNSAYSLESGPDAPTVAPTGRLPQVDGADLADRS